MMTQLIDEKIKDAMRAKDKESLEVMRSIKTSFTNLEKEKTDLTETDYLILLKKLAKQRVDSAKMYLEGNRTDLYEKEMFEFDIISDFLPKNLTQEEAEQLVKQVIYENDFTLEKKNMGNIVKLTVLKAAGRTDGKTISTIVNKFIDSSPG